MPRRNSRRSRPARSSSRCASSSRARRTERLAQGGEGRERQLVETIVDRSRLRGLLDNDHGGLRVDIDPLAMNADGAEGVMVVAGLVPLAAVASGREQVDEITIEPGLSAAGSANVVDPG